MNPAERELQRRYDEWVEEVLSDEILGSGCMGLVILFGCAFLWRILS